MGQVSSQQDNPTAQDNQAYRIALVIIISFIVVFVFVLLISPSLIKDVGAIWGVWIGTAIGYFFGNRPVDALIRSLMRLNETRLRELEEEKNRMKEEKKEISMAVKDYEQQLIVVKEDLEGLNARYQQAKKDIVTILKKCEQQLDKDLVERLKKEYVD